MRFFLGKKLWCMLSNVYSKKWSGMRSASPKLTLLGTQIVQISSQLWKHKPTLLKHALWVFIWVSRNISNTSKLIKCVFCAFGAQVYNMLKEFLVLSFCYFYLNLDKTNSLIFPLYSVKNNRKKLQQSTSFALLNPWDKFLVNMPVTRGKLGAWDLGHRNLHSAICSSSWHGEGSEGWGCWVSMHATLQRSAPSRPLSHYGHWGKLARPRKSVIFLQTGS